MSSKPKRLLEKYDILLEQLDYGYIGKCPDSRVLEKIIKILRSGQEGYYPDLTSFAERRLRMVNPKSKLFREETPLVTKNCTTRECWEKINQDLVAWETDMHRLQKDILNEKGISIEDVPPVRIKYTEINTPYVDQTSVTYPRLKSYDYTNWDRYDADAEILKMDLDEERHKDSIAKQNEKKSSKTMIQEDQHNNLDHISEAEKKVLATKSREKGNDYFRSKDYEQALHEYNRSITIFPTASCFNNRAITNIKLKRFDSAINDCEACLTEEPNNLKALIRKAQAFKLNDKCREAYQAFSQVLLVDPNSQLALKTLKDLRIKFQDLPPPNAFQLKIEEIGRENEDIDEDYAALIKPKTIVKDRLSDTMKCLQTNTIKRMQKSDFTKEEIDKIEIIPRFSKKVFIEEIK